MRKNLSLKSSSILSDVPMTKYRQQNLKNAIKIEIRRIKNANLRSKNPDISPAFIPSTAYLRILGIMSCRPSVIIRATSPRKILNLYLRKYSFKTKKFLKKYSLYYFTSDIRLLKKIDMRKFAHKIAIDEVSIGEASSLAVRQDASPVIFFILQLCGLMPGSLTLFRNPFRLGCSS